jgi:Ca2+-binding EF-hand superfamily protein
MKTTSLITLAALIGTSSFAAAQEKPNRPDRPPREIPAALLETFDTDKDGKLSDDERNAMRAAMKAKAEERRAAMLAKYDKDGDGKLSDDEKAMLHADMQAKRLALIEKYDADQDGKLSPAEIKTARDAGEELPPPGMGPGPDGKRGGHGGQRGPGGPGGPDVAPPAPPAE